MSKFKIEKGISRVQRVKLQATIEDSIAQDLALLCEWSNNEKNYVVNELLRFAISQDAEFQAHKESLGSRSESIAQPQTTNSVPTSERIMKTGNARVEPVADNK